MNNLVVSIKKVRLLGGIGHGFIGDLFLVG